MLSKERKSVNFTASSVIEDKIVENYQCTIKSDNPSELNYTSWIADKELYKSNRKICQQDRAEFEDAMYALQDAMIVENKTE